MSYWILSESGILVSRTTVQGVTYLEICTNAIKQRFGVYDKAIREIFRKKCTEEAFAVPNITKPAMEIWSGLAKDDEDF